MIFTTSFKKKSFVLSLKNMFLDIHIINCVILLPGTGFCSSFCNHCEAIVKVSSGECKVRLRIVSAISQRYSAAENRMPSLNDILQQKTECPFTMVFCSRVQNATSQWYSAAENRMPFHNSILQQKTECHFTMVFCSRIQNAISWWYSAAENGTPSLNGILQQKTDNTHIIFFSSDFSWIQVTFPSRFTDTRPMHLQAIYRSQSLWTTNNCQQSKTTTKIYVSNHESAQ